MAFEEQLQQLAAGVPPPPAGDAAAIIRRGTRRRRRRLAAGVGAVAAAIAVLATVLPPLPGGPGVPQIFGRPDAPATPEPEPDGLDPEPPVEDDLDGLDPEAWLGMGSPEPFEHVLKAMLMGEQGRAWCVAAIGGPGAQDSSFEDLDRTDCQWTFSLNAAGAFDEPARPMGAITDDGALLVWGIASPPAADRGDIQVVLDGEEVGAAASWGRLPFAVWSAGSLVTPETIEVRQDGETVATLSWPFDPADPWGATRLDPSAGNAATTEAAD